MTLGRSIHRSAVWPATALVLALLAAPARTAERPWHQAVTDDDASVDGLNGSSGIAVSPDGKHVYATGSFDDAVVVLTRGGDGTLAFTAAVFDTDSGIDGLDAPRGVAVSPDGRHVYVASLFDGVTVFSRDATTGLLTFVEAQLDGGGGGPSLGGAHGVTVSPDGKHVYVVARSEDAISTFARDAGTGALTYVESDKNGIGGVTGMDAAEGVAVSPDNEFVYVAAESSDSVAVFDRDTATGALTFVEALFDGVGGVDGLRGANSIVVSPDGKHVYAAGEFDDDTLGDDDLGAVFRRDQITGALTFVETIPPFLDTTGDLDCLGVSGGGGIAVNGAGDRVYVTESWQSALLVFARDGTTGALTRVEEHCEFLHGLGNVNQLAVSPDGVNVYTTGLDGSVAAFGPNRPPTVGSPIAGVTVGRNAPDTLIDLTAAFTDPDRRDVLTLSVTQNSNPALLTASIVGNTLTLDYVADQSGSADLTITATDPEGESASGPLSVTVDPVDHPLPDFRVTKADVKLSPKPSKDKVTLRGKFPKLGKSFDPRSTAASISVGDPAAPLVIAIPSGDAGWKGRKGSWKWKSAKGVVPKTVLAVNGRKGKFSVSVKKFDLVATPAISFAADVSVGGEVVSEIHAFEDRKKGRFRYRP